MSIRLLIAEDHDLVREGLRGAFANTEITPVGEAKNGEEAVRMALEDHVDVLLLDIKMPELDGFEVLQRVMKVRPNLPVLIYSQFERAEFRARARQLGACGYLTKTVSKRELLAAIRAVSLGENHWPNSDRPA